MSVTPTVWVRPRQGPKLADLITEPNTTAAQGDSDTVDVLGSAYAATDGDPATAWTAPQRVVQHKSPPSLTLRLPHPTEVSGVRLVPSRSALPVRPTMVAVNLGDGPQAARLAPDADGAGQAQTVAVKPRVTDTVTISLLNWQDVIDRNALGFDQLKPPGLAEVVVLGADGKPIAPADPGRNRSREIAVGCDHGPVIAVAGRFVHTAIHTTVGAILDDAPVAAVPCERDPIALPAGQQELLISPGAQFVVDGAELATRPAAEGARPVRVSSWQAWGPDRREVHAPASATSRILVIPESINPGWVAHTGTGARLTPIAVNGWQQGWVVPAGDPGTITLTFASNTLYRAGLAVGLALLPLLAMLALWRTRRKDADDEAAPAQPWRPGAWAAVPALAAAAVIAGVGGVMAMGTALGLRYALRRRRWERLSVVCSAGGLILAGAALSRQPWRSPDGYAGHSASVQLLALISLAVLAASVVALPHRRADRTAGRGDE
jgi:arabinofuranan 3-O-arabinosyltransferase